MICGAAADGSERSAWTEAHRTPCDVESSATRASVRALEDSDVYARTRLAPLAARRLATASPIPVFQGRGQSTSGREEMLVVRGWGRTNPASRR